MFLFGKKTPKKKTSDPKKPSKKPRGNPKRKSSAKSTSTPLGSSLSLLATGALHSLSDRYPRMYDVLGNDPAKKPFDSWQLLYKAAGIGMAILSSEEFKGERKKINAYVKKDTALEKAVVDFVEFMEMGSKKDPKMTENQIYTSIGIWMIWNMEGKKSDDEKALELAPMIGVLIVETVKETRGLAK